MKPQRFRKLMLEIGATVVLVGITSFVTYMLVEHAGVNRGSVLYLIPVVLAATCWGLIPALVAAFLGVFASAFFFFPPLYSFEVKDPQEVINLVLFIFVAVVTSQLAMRLKRQLEISRQREIEMRDLYAFTRRLAVAYGVSDIHAAIEDHLTTIMQRTVALFAAPHGNANGFSRRHEGQVPERVYAEVLAVAAGRGAIASEGTSVTGGTGRVWLVRAVSLKTLEFGVIAVHLGNAAQEDIDEVRSRIDTVLADATATLERLGIAHAISEARMRSETEKLRDALIGSVSHELRTPLASILGAATVLSSAPALKNEKALQALVNDVRNEAERLNGDIQNLLDATRISSDGIKPHTEWADPADIVHSAVERCRRRLGERRIALDVPGDLPLIYVDSVLVEQAMVQIFDNAAKYSPPNSRIDVSAHTRNGSIVLAVSDQGTGLAAREQERIWERFFRSEQHAATTNGSGLGLWIANAFIAANGGKIYADSNGAGYGTTLSIELPVSQAALEKLDGDADE
jgi:two-component system sensor histidine kinase KdpD